MSKKFSKKCHKFIKEIFEFSVGGLELTKVKNAALLILALFSFSYCFKIFNFLR